MHLYQTDKKTSEIFDPPGHSDIGGHYFLSCSVRWCPENKTLENNESLLAWWVILNSLILETIFLHEGMTTDDGHYKYYCYFGGQQ